jgi:hypothetical protein
MGTYRIPKITWSGSYAATLNVGYPLDNWAAYSNAFEGSQFVQVESGTEDAWIINTEYVLEGDIRWIPTTNGVNPTQTGWDGVNGVRAFLEYGRAKNTFRWYPNKDEGTYIESYLVEPLNGAHGLEPDGTRTIRIKIRNSTTDYSGY